MSTCTHECVQHPPTPSLHQAIFEDEPGLAGFIEAKDDGSGGDI